MPVTLKVKATQTAEQYSYITGGEVTLSTAGTTASSISAIRLLTDSPSSISVMSLYANMLARLTQVLLGATLATCVKTVNGCSGYSDGVLFINGDACTHIVNNQPVGNQPQDQQVCDTLQRRPDTMYHAGDAVSYAVSDVVYLLICQSTGISSQQTTLQIPTGPVVEGTIITDGQITWKVTAIVSSLPRDQHTIYVVDQCPSCRGNCQLAWQLSQRLQLLYMILSGVIDNQLPFDDPNTAVQQNWNWLQSKRSRAGTSLSTKGCQDSVIGQREQYLLNPLKLFQQYKVLVSIWNYLAAKTRRHFFVQPISQCPQGLSIVWCYRDASCAMSSKTLTFNIKLSNGQTKENPLQGLPGDPSPTLFYEKNQVNYLFFIVNATCTVEFDDGTKESYTYSNQTAGNTFGMSVTDYSAASTSAIQAKIKVTFPQPAVASPKTYTVKFNFLPYLTRYQGLTSGGVLDNAIQTAKSTASYQSVVGQKRLMPTPLSQKRNIWQIDCLFTDSKTPPQSEHGAQTWFTTAAYMPVFQKTPTASITTDVYYYTDEGSVHYFYKVDSTQKSVVRYPLSARSYFYDSDAKTVIKATSVIPGNSQTT